MDPVAATLMTSAPAHHPAHSVASPHGADQDPARQVMAPEHPTVLPDVRAEVVPDAAGTAQLRQAHQQSRPHNVTRRDGVPQPSIGSPGVAHGRHRTNSAAAGEVAT